jgi:hypothetical protein
MKYKDKNVLNSWNKQVNKLYEEDSNRKINRKYERDLNKFSKSICLILDKEWWECVSNDQKNVLFNEWMHISRNATSSTKYRHKPPCLEIIFENWAKEIKKIITIDKALYREKRINKLILE